MTKPLYELADRRCFKKQSKKKGKKYIEYFIQKSEYFILLILFHFKHTFFIKSLFVCVCVFQ